MTNAAKFDIEDTDTYTVALDKVVSEVLTDWAWRVPSGTPDIKDPSHIAKLRTVMEGYEMEHGLIESVIKSME